MRKILTKMGLRIQKMIDCTYPLFRRFISLQLYRYAVCGSANVMFDWVMYFLVYNVFFKDEFFHLGIVTLSPHIASLAVIFPVTTFSGFLLQKYVTFTTSDLRGRIQLMRYFTIVFANLLINYAGLKLCVDGLFFYPTPSKMLVTIIAIIVSYIGQKTYTFKTVVSSK